MDQGIIRRKVAGGQGEPAATFGAERAWPLALGRVAQHRLGLALDCADVRASRLSLAELLELVPDHGLIALLEGPRESTGLLMLAPNVLAALTETLTLGRVGTQPVAPRKPTRTDAALVADFLDAALSGLEDALLNDEDLVWCDGYRYTSFLDEPRALALILEDAGFKVLRTEADLGGRRRGEITLALPAEGHGRRPQRPVASPADPLPDTRFTADFAAEVMEVQAELTAILGSLRLPLAGALGLTPGQILPLGAAAIDRIQLVGQDGRTLALAKLGQHRGARALRLGEAVSRDGAPPIPLELPQPLAEIAPLRAVG